MRFNCGITNEEWQKRVKEWHRHFAILPVTVEVREDGSRVCAWLETVERRAKWAFTDHDGRWGIYEYRYPLPSTTKESK